jgi:hypothetical protein
MPFAYQDSDVHPRYDRGRALTADEIPALTDALRRHASRPGKVALPAVGLDRSTSDDGDALGSFTQLLPRSTKSMIVPFLLMLTTPLIGCKDQATPATNASHLDAGTIRDKVYVNPVVGMEVPIPEAYRAVPYTELKAQWEQSEKSLGLSEKEQEAVKNQFNSNDILNLQVKRGAPAYANLRIIATPQPLRGGKPLTAQQHATEHFSGLRNTVIFGNSTLEMKSEKPEPLSKGGREYYVLKMAVDVPAFKTRLEEVELFTTHSGYNIVIVIATMEAKDAEVLATLIEHIKYTTP